MFPERSTQQAAVTRTSFDAGLQKHMQSVYNRMTLGVLVTAIAAFVVGSSPALMQLFLGGPQKWIVMLAPLGIVWFGFNPMTMKQSTLQTSFYAISVLYGISFSVIGYVYAGADIARAFFVATGMFAGLSIFGYVTKKNLSGLGNFAVMGIIGVLVAGLLNLFIFKNQAFGDVISMLAILAFAGLTAWQTQAVKEMYHPSAGEEANSRLAWVAALNFYISFIALFSHILHLMGGRE